MIFSFKFKSLFVLFFESSSTRTSTKFATSTTKYHAHKQTRAVFSLFVSFLLLLLLLTKNKVKNIYRKEDLYHILFDACALECELNQLKNISNIYLQRLKDSLSFCCNNVCQKMVQILPKRRTFGYIVALYFGRMNS